MPRPNGLVLYVDLVQQRRIGSGSRPSLGRYGCGRSHSPTTVDMPIVSSAKPSRR